ncbi:hypothetical protein HGRIS_002501 [Hohenbuehelia grisea]|uniref:Ribosomal RNA-processing protein 12-like conserved domain-containing protein n=1 Tax=Hohenbuehelia grisea TaxID=104357 RepID=A0ABR3JMP8_9AGAR
MDSALAKIRRLTSSKLAHQKTPATLLVALESTLDEQHTERTPTAYFASLLTTLDGTLQKKEIGLDEGDVLPAELYLLALVAPFVPVPVIRSNLETILALTAPLFPSLIPHAPALKSQISLYQVVFVALDRTQLEIQGIRQVFASVLQLCLDTRPKVRKQAAEAVHDVLRNAPPPLSRHPYADRVAEWVKTILAEISADPLAASKSYKASQATSTEAAIHMLAFVRPVLAHLPPPSLPTLTTLLLTLPRLGHPYLSQSAYAILADLFFTTVDDTSSGVDQQIPEVLQAIISSPPLSTDATLSPSWLRVLGSLMNAYGQLYPQAAAQEVLQVWKKAWQFLESKDPATRQAAVECLESLSHCFTPDFIEKHLGKANSSKSSLTGIVAQVTKALDSLSFARSIPELLSVISILLKALRHKEASLSPSVAERLALPLVQKVGELRTQKGFEYKEQADAALSTAMQVLGPKVLLEVLPLNLEPADREAGGEPRAYLLPLLTQPHCSPLGHFVAYFVPLSERMFDLQQKAESEGRQSEAKVWSVLVAQIWAGLSGYCHCTPDLQEALTPAFAQLLSQLLYSQTELRPSILKSLKIIVDSNVALTSPSPDAGSKAANATISPEVAAANVAFLRTQAESWLAVFFNVFGSVGRDGRGMVGDVISAWAAIAGDNEIRKAYAKVVQLFKTNLANAKSAPQPHSAIEGGSVTAMTQDILILLLPYLPANESQALFELCLSADVLSVPDNGVQKRGYKILAKLLERGTVKVEAEVVLRQLDSVVDGLTPAAKRDRFCLLALLVPLISSDSLHLIPSLIPEAVLGTKEPSEKSRGAAFDLIIAMGRKMGEGGVVKRDMVDGMDEDGAGNVTANVEEFMTMVAGGLAGATPHMISATVTAISRLVFEFKDTISQKMQVEIFSTLLVFLSSANREIVKSVLGFVKLAIHTLSVDILRPHLKEVVPALLKWSHDHKNHFKVKVRHIFERMLRRFGWDEVYGCADKEEAAKVLVNIKKRKERAKRKRAAREQDGDAGHEVEASNKPTAGTAFEDVLYGSESELEDSDDDEPSAQPKTHKKQHSGTQGPRLRIDDDEPMDLLSGAASRITNASKDRRRKPGQDTARFKTNESGKMVIDGEDSDEAAGEIAGDNVAGDAYRESITSVDGFTRGPNGRVKFHKDTKKRRREEADADMDVDMADETPSARGGAPKNKRRTEPKLGHEFKAKKAGGDIKKGGVDPYAYVSLTQAAKKGRRGNIGIAGKR